MLGTGVRTIVVSRGTGVPGAWGEGWGMAEDVDQVAGTIHLQVLDSMCR